MSPADERTVAASPAAAHTLQLVAARAATAPELEVENSQFSYVRSADITNVAGLGEDPALGAIHTREIWRGQDPSAWGGGEDVIHEFGQDWPITSTGPLPVGPDRPTYRWLASLPSNPDDLLDEIESYIRANDVREPEQAAFSRIGDFISSGLVPPRTAAALYEAATLIEGVSVNRDAVDAIGRTGIGITRTDSMFGTRSEWIFDDSTYALLGVRDYFMAPDGTETLFGASAVVETAVVDDAGQRPGSNA